MRRQILLTHNAGIWQGTFIRLDGNGRELERFGSHLEVADRAGIIHADLTNRSTGKVRSMQFAEPPAEMQISPEGHWSLGPDRIGPWPWVCELCLVWGEQRRRAVVRHHSSGLESLVLVWEARPGVVDPPPAAPLILSSHPLASDAAAARLVWQPDPRLELETMAGPRGVEAEQVLLRWDPEGTAVQTLRRAYGSYGALIPLG